MCVDTILFALTTLERNTQIASHHDLSEKRRLLLTVGYMRDQLLRNDPVAFTNTINSGLAAHPDLYDYVMDDLFYRLGVSTREHFDAILVDPNI
jgi:hypothetical protein